MKAHAMCASPATYPKNHLFEPSFGTDLQEKKAPNDRNQGSDESYISCMILLFLLFSGTSPVNRITAVTNEIQRPVGTLTATMPKVHRPRLNLAFAPMNSVSDLLAQAQLTEVSQGKKGNDKITLPLKQARLPLVNLVNTSQIVTRIQLLKRQNWPKLKRLGQAVHRNSRRILLLRAHLSALQSQLKERTSPQSASMKTALCKQEQTQAQLAPGRMYLLGYFLIQHFLKRYNEGRVGNDLVDMPNLAALLIDQFHCLRE
ncbi:unnamed protein product [Penicillium salamii]|uniref:Uncharacterized protein n=1 Tax=Penicillium salamii TaxID=1612424 RepID=A0A9W4JDV8_9EURO|nr:unnamed protein product [Penicillium salamii]CAG8173080.1 unnamed protein product [Penicillium salamii]CAG8180746.1 unnamed protein product [Penicillium salamii]CAG8185597.1 unnamed protein product [Penicillium salamii]CAG8360981.1 unnamed protein product [Penicillium salamii]